MAKLKDVIEGRWSNYAMLGIEDYEVVYWRGEADYQGSCEYIVRSVSWWGDPVYIEFGWSYGSCSGCDGYEEQSHQQNIKEFVNGRVEYDFASLKEYGKNLLIANPVPGDGWGRDGHAKAMAIRAEIERVEKSRN